MRGRPRSFLVSLGLLGLLAPGSSRATEDRWTHLGPSGGDVRAIAVAPSQPQVLYAGTNFGGVFRSADAGVSWEPANGGLSRLDVRALAVDPTSPHVVYVGLAYGGVFKTADGGNSWSARNEGLGETSHGCEVSALAIDPSSPQTIYAGVCGNGVYKSVDGGATWTPPDPSMRFANAAALAVDPGRPSTLYAGGWGSVAKSLDSGATWIRLLGGATVYTSVVVDPTSPDTVYAGFDSGRIARSVDGGASWVYGETDAIPGDVTALAIDPRVPSTVYAATRLGRLRGGLFRSSDSGRTWSPVRGIEVGTVNALAVAPGPAPMLFAGALAQGVLSSENGLSWRESNSGLNAVRVTAVAVDPFDPSVLYVSRGDLGVSRSRNGGVTWKLANEGLPAFAFDAVTADPTFAGVVYAGSLWGGLFKSADPRRHMDAIESRASAVRGCDRSGSSSSPPTIYAGTVATGVFRSSNAGESWSPSSSVVGVGSVPSFAFDPFSPGTVYTPTYYTPGPCTLGCPILPGVLARSTDGGDRWISLPSLENIAAVAVDPANPGRLYAGVGAEEGIFVSLDAGERWDRRMAGLEGVSVSAVATSAGAPVAIYAGSRSDGVFRSADGGLTWSSISRGLADRRIRFLSRSPNGETLYAGTDGGGLYEIQIAPPALPGCSPSATALCLAAGRFEVRVAWTASALPANGAGQTMALTADAGAFWFFQPSNIEFVVKILDGRGINGHFWVFYGALTNVGYTIR